MASAPFQPLPHEPQAAAGQAALGEAAPGQAAAGLLPLSKAARRFGNRLLNYKLNHVEQVVVVLRAFGRWGFDEIGPAADVTPARARELFASILRRDTRAQEEAEQHVERLRLLADTERAPVKSEKRTARGARDGGAAGAAGAVEIRVTRIDEPKDRRTVYPHRTERRKRVRRTREDQ